MTLRSDRAATDGRAPVPATATDVSAERLLADYATGEGSPVTAVDAALARIDRDDPGLNAFCLVLADEARAAARASAERWERGAPVGPLDGVPVAVKDVHLLRGHPTLKGSLTTPSEGPWEEDSPAVARLREAGAIFVGKTTTPELAWKAVTDSPLTGVTRNPWDPATTPGGSSGGSAAAVAAGMVPMATGTDGGGSIRIPASFSGIVGIKPTWGLVPHYPASPFGSLAHTGPMTRTVGDTALMLEVMTGSDHRDWAALAPPGPGLGDVRLRTEPGDLIRGTRIALAPTLGGLAVDPEVTAAVLAAADVLSDLGAHVVEADPGLPDARWEFHVLWYAGAAKATERVTGPDRDLLDPGLREIIEEGLAFSAQDYLTAMASRMEMGARMGRFHTEHDLLLTPATPFPAFEAGRECPPELAGERWTAWAGFSHPFNMTQQPAASVPCGFTSAGLPVGLQVVGPRHADARVLAACRALELARPWSERRP
ncbi:amidase [Nocardiopsis lambiniae]|uniref:Amidase n=1 Tax=Nocardiopsis lambiniae TaxID=3075539 RepID=A0ABU2MAZ1_9ACTN|nr:amidase [Nocardiopsis sp. DSM 44743]MDT0329849.1 amidase [Nocardiopsis sp. DSM 44743]